MLAVRRRLELSPQRGDNREAGRGFACGRSDEVRCRLVLTKGL
jgi:hypothetical protein